MHSGKKTFIVKVHGQRINYELLLLIQCTCIMLYSKALILFNVLKFCNLYVLGNANIDLPILYYFKFRKLTDR